MQHLAALSRRNLLKTGLIGSVIVGLGGIGLALRESAPPATTPPLSVFDAREYGILTAIADRLCPPLGEGAPGAVALDTVRKLDGVAARMDSDTQQGIKLSLKVFDNALGGALVGERISPFTELSAEAKDRVLAAWRDSRIGFRRTVYKALSSAIQSIYWGDARTWPRIGYGGPPDLAALRAAYADNLVALDTLRASPVKQEI